MLLLLVRHAQPVTEVRTDGGFADPPLSDIGCQQAKLAARWLDEMGPFRVYSSPMCRAFQTAEPIAAAVGTNAIEVRDGLSEFDRHASSYVPMEVLKHTDRAQWDQLASGTFSPGDNEVAQAWIALVVNTIEAIVSNHPGEPVAVVCHGGVINAYLAHCLGFAAESFLRFDVDYTSLTRVLASSRGHRSVLSINERTHLRGHPELTLGA